MLKLTGGDHKGRSLKWLNIAEIRPTPARVREAIFNVLVEQIEGSQCWDLCCGSGVVGLEALSRGAAHVTFVEHNTRSLGLLRQNLQHLGLKSQARVIGADLRRFLQQQKTLTAALIYCDPPYDSQLYQPVLDELGQKPAAPGLEQVTLILEYRRGQLNWEARAPWVLQETRKYGDTCLAFLQRSLP